MKLDLEMILSEWKTDCQIPTHQLDETSRQTPMLHAKYLQYLSTAKLSLKRAEHAQKILLKDKWLYYNGKMDENTLKSKGWEPDRSVQLSANTATVQYLTFNVEFRFSSFELR